MNILRDDYIILFVTNLTKTHHSLKIYAVQETLINAIVNQV